MNEGEVTALHRKRNNLQQVKTSNAHYRYVIFQTKGGGDNTDNTVVLISQKSI